MINDLLNYPRVLCMSSSVFNPLTGGGITLTNLFTDWPRERIAMIHNDAILPDPSVCDNFFKCEQVHWTHRLRDWIADFKPDLLYTLLGDLTHIRLAHTIKREFSIPVVLHFMDDWPAGTYRQGLPARWLRWQMQEGLVSLIESASLCMGVSTGMCEAFGRRYRQRFIPFHNVLDSSSWIELSKAERRPEEPFRVVYSGSIEQSEVIGLMQVCEAIVALRNEGMNIKFNIHTPHFYSERHASLLTHLPGVEVCQASENQTDAAELLTNADLLVIAINFDETATNQFRYSMPAKVPAYMLSGTPILVYGPHDVDYVRSAMREGWGYSIILENQFELKKAIKTLMKNTELRTKLGMRARELAVSRYDAARVRPAFHQCLADAASSAKRSSPQSQ
jgi:glycosyltransferase involved in cell wall biosynthesis